MVESYQFAAVNGRYWLQRFTSQPPCSTGFQINCKMQSTEFEFVGDWDSILVVHKFFSMHVIYGWYQASSFKLRQCHILFISYLQTAFSVALKQKKLPCQLFLKLRFETSGLVVSKVLGSTVIRDDSRSHPSFWLVDWRRVDDATCCDWLTKTFSLFHRSSRGPRREAGGQKITEAVV